MQDVECLREAFALFDPDKEKEVLTPERLGKVREFLGHVTRFCVKITKD